jgi:hypothetical protein
MDEPADDDERGSQIQVEVDDLAVAFGAASKFAVTAHLRVGPIHHPPLAGLDRGRPRLAGDLALEAKHLQQCAGPDTILSRDQDG